MDAVTNERLVTALKIILSEDYVLMPPASIIRNSFWNLHTDTTTMTVQGFPFDERPDFTGVAIGTYLQDSSDQGGGMFVVPGTHKKQNPLVKRKKQMNGIDVPLYAKVLRKLTGNRLPNYEDFSVFEKDGIDLPSQSGVIRTQTKFGLFNLAAAPGEGDFIDKWMDYLHSEHYHAAYAIKENRNAGPLKAAAKEAGFVAL